MRGLFLGLIMSENRLPVFSDYLGGSSPAKRKRVLEKWCGCI